VFARIPAIVKPQTGKGNQYMALNEEFESKIGKGTKASGKLNFRGPVKIEGEAEGEITGEEVVITTGAVVSARISASKVTIAGAFSGEVTARERVELMATARVQCTINTPSFVLNEGAQFDGDCKMPSKKLAA
jgi:cytoskeletal protein CcmA (bactofilin family)